MYDRQDKNIYEYTTYNDDYLSRINISMSRPSNNDKIAYLQKIEAYQLIEALEKGELKEGKLKDIAAKLDAEDNPVIMLVKHKK
jgi:hypothetical protein